VIDAATNPLAGVTVRLEPWQGSTLVNWQTETDADGRFSWDSAPTSAAMYSLGKSGYVTQRRDDFSVEDETTITLMKAFLLTGKVVDAETGEPVTQFQVIKGRRYGPDDLPHWERHNTVRGRDGEYSLKHDEPSGPKVQVLVEAEGYLPEVSPPFLSTGWHTNDFKLKKGEGPRGMVKGPSGKPVEGAQVALLSGGYVNLGSAQFRDPRGGDTHIAITDTDGRFSLPAAYARNRRCAQLWLCGGFARRVVAVA
jgi:hypothetical protein